MNHTLIILDEIIVPVDKIHSNLLNEIIILLRGRYGLLHVIMNTKTVEVGDGDRTANGAVWRVRDETREAVVGRARFCMGEDTGLEGWGKRSQLVKNVWEYSEG